MLGMVFMRDCSERHVETMLPKALWDESVGGLAGGDAKRADWRRGMVGCDASQGKAAGSSIAGVEVDIAYDECRVAARVGDRASVVLRMRSQNGRSVLAATAHKRLYATRAQCAQMGREEGCG